MKKFFLLGMSALLLSACGGPDESEFKSQVPEVSPESTTAEEVPSETTPALTDLEEEIASTSEPEAEMVIPDQINLEVPFFSQAPEGDWSQPWQDACEESSLILAHYGLLGESLNLDQFKQLVLAMVDWQNERFGYYESTTVDQVVELYEGFFEDAFDVTVIDDPTAEDLKKELAQGNLIVAPFAGRMLGNPFYSGEGPYYHMLVIKGYDSTHFITNDVGTRRGENFIYTYDALLNALHDYQEPGIETTPGRVIVLGDSSN